MTKLIKKWQICKFIFHSPYRHLLPKVRLKQNITTGNELVRDQIADFSKSIALDELFAYASEVKQNTEAFLKTLSHQDLKRRFDSSKKEYLKSINVVSEDPNASWLIDYWCDKDLGGLIRMPFSRHWIMHIEAALRIIKKLPL